MTNDPVAFWLVTMGVVEVIAAAIAIFAVFPAGHDFHVALKTGFAVMVLGLVVQLGRSLYYWQNGSHPTDEFFPLWISKDIGASILIFYYAFVHKGGAK